MELELFPDNCMNERTLKNELRAGAGWVAEFALSLVGYSLIRGDEALLDITRLAVLPDYQRQGIGKAFLNLALLSSKTTMLSVRKDNQRALAFYLRYGFRIVGDYITVPSWAMIRTTSAGS